MPNVNDLQLRPVDPAAPEHSRGALWRLPGAYRLPDGRRVKGPAPGLACLLEAIPSGAGLAATVAAAPVLPGNADATRWDLVVSGESALGFAARVVLPAARRIPVATLDSHVVRLDLPDAIAGWVERIGAETGRALIGSPPELPSGTSGWLDAGAGYLDLVHHLHQEWRYLDRVANWFRHQDQAGRLAEFSRLSAAPVPFSASARGRTAPSWVLAASDGETPAWKDSAAVCVEFAGGLGVLALLRQAGEWVIEIDTAPGLEVEAVRLDGRLIRFETGIPPTIPLRWKKRPIRWLCLQTNQGPWTWRIPPYEPGMATVAP